MKFEKMTLNMVNHCFATSGGIRLHWVDLGFADRGIPTVLLHGIGDSHLTWNRTAAFLADNRRLLILDLPGHGLSETVDASYTLRWHAQMVAQWLTVQGIEQIDLVGHSFGGGVAQMLLLECPERIRRIVLVASGGLGKDIGFWLRLASLPYIVELFGQPFMGFGTRLAILSLKNHIPPQEFEDLIQMNQKAGSARSFSRTVRDVISWRGQTRSFYQHLQEIKTLPPIAVIWGAQDQLIPLTHGKSFANLFKGVHFVEFANCGHFIHQEEPAAFANAVNEFLDQVEAPQAFIPTNLVDLEKPEQLRKSI